MADAKKCDRCGSFYDKMADPGTKFLLSKCVSVSTPAKSDLVKIVDLCPECSKLLDLWMECKADICMKCQVGDIKEDKE